MCKFQFRFRLMHCGTITPIILYRFSANFVCGSEMWSVLRLLFVRQTGSSFPVLEACGLRWRQFSGSYDHSFQQISIKSHIHIKFSNADLAFNGKRNRKQKSDFTDVQIPVSISFSALWNDDVLKILHADQKCDGFYVWCFGNHKLKVEIRFQRCAGSYFSSFQALVNAFFNCRRRIPNRPKVKIEQR